ncbi:hypothetical protein PPTG_07445 [Phytophthora nicotianae INRA-310]|uniref:Uncharacterized protein n=2 Tax=Phytophthora nicotianae TaxID=4792 RepID=W2QMH1_PHYN3|nr:hypothetical protein PPTG_07445 [Phytophthora nicotianae INRA-310]ETN14387.1 hypothetical protein PPTG_07445 [Phytophthora nicotianae INRA-310]
MPTTEPTDTNTAPRKRRKTSKNRLTNVVEKDALDLARDKLPEGYTPDIFIGIDPDVRILVTAASTGYLPQQRQGRQCKHRHRRRRFRKKDSRKCIAKNQHGHGQRVIGVSTAEYYHLAKLNKKRVWDLNLRKTEPAYVLILKEMPSFNTSQLTTFMDRLQYFVKHVGFLVSYSTKTSFRKWRFLTTSSKMRALTAITKRLVPIRSAQVCIAFGDWSCQDGLCGNPSAPVQALKKELEQ